MSNSDNNQNSSQYPFTNTDMFVGLLANSDKLQPEDKRYQYNGEKNPELDDDHANYISEKNNNSERHTENITDTRNSETKNTDTRNTETKNTDTRNTETYNNTQTEKKDDSTVKKDDDENLTPEELMLRKLDMLRKLSELAQAGVKLSQNYNMNSDYKMMKYEYELHKGIRAKQNGINWMSSMSLNLIYGVEMLNEKYNPFDLKLKGWSEQMNADVNNYYDVFGELYEKYNQPGKNMAPELKLLLMVSGSALKFHLTNTMMSNLPTLNTQLDEDPVLAEQLRQKAIAQKIKEQSVKNNEALKQTMNKQHEEATQKAHDLNLIRQKEMELQNLKRENAQKNAELEAYKEKLLMSQTQSNTNLNKSVVNNTNNTNNIQQKPVQSVQQVPSTFPIHQPTNLNQNNIPQQQIRAPPAVQRMMMARQTQQNNQVNFEDQMRQQYGLNNSTVVNNKLDNLQAQANYMEELEKLKLLRIQKEKELEEEKRKTLLKQQIKKETESSSETSESSKKSSSSSETSKTSKSSVEFNINLKTILSDSKNKMLDITSSDKIKNLGVVSKDEISKSNISLGKKRVKKDKESKDSKDSKETRETKESLKSDKQKVVRQKKTGISLV